MPVVDLFDGVRGLVDERQAELDAQFADEGEDSEVRFLEIDVENVRYVDLELRYRFMGVKGRCFRYSEVVYVEEFEGVFKELRFRYYEVADEGVAFRTDCRGGMQ